MLTKISRLVCLLGCLATGSSLMAQNGHPLNGTFSGDFWLKPGQENHIVIQFTHVGTYEGDDVRGIFNPGPAAVPLKKLTIIPPRTFAEGAKGWTIRFEVDAKDQAGKMVHYVVDGQLENIGAFNKRMSGVWSANGQKGQFKMVMQ